jgi:ribonuclease R
VDDAWLGELVVTKRGAAARPLAGGNAVVLAESVDAPEGATVRVERRESGWEATEALAAPKSPLSRMYRIVSRHGLAPFFPPAVRAEVAALVAEPGIDDDRLVDLTALPFVTIDGAGTRDLDQALHLARDGAELVVRYAIADAAHYVRPGSALFAEALARGASYYLPGLSVPMLPRALSEGVVSLNPEVERRAVVFETRLDGEGRIIATRLSRARIRSRAKLAYDEVQRFLDDPAMHPLRVAEAEPSVALLPVVGQLRLEEAGRRDVIAFRRAEATIELDGERLAFVFGLAERTRVELYNEQLSLLCNVEGARFLRDGADPALLQPIYRVHPEPEEGRYLALERLLAAIAERHQLDPARWRWRRGESLAEYLAALPTDGREGRIASAIHRQAVLINLRSTYALEPAPHFGVGAEVYGRFSAPMREIVGVFLHKEALERVDGGPGGPDDEALRLQIVARANEARELQKRLDKDANRIVIDAVFERDLGRATSARPWRGGTAMGMTPGKIHVLLDDPPIEVKVYANDLGRGGERVELAPDGAAMVRNGEEICRIGDEIAIQVQGRDRRNHWSLFLRRSAQADRPFG